MYVRVGLAMEGDVTKSSVPMGSLVTGARMVLFRLAYPSMDGRGVSSEMPRPNGIDCVTSSGDERG